MMLLAPWALWFSAAGVAIVGLYLLKIKRRRQEVPSLEFWRRLAGQTQVRSLFQRLKRWLSMLLWLLIAACLVLALGNPLLAFGKIQARSIILVIDNSASMQAIESGEDESSRPRLDDARAAVERMLEGRPVRDEWMLLEAGAQPRVLAAWTREPRDIRTALAAMQPFHGSGDLDAAVLLARQLAQGRDDPAIVLISDGGRAATLIAGSANPLPPPAESADDAPELIYWPIGASSDNLGVAHLRVRLHRRQAAHHVLVRVVNDSNESVEADLLLEIDGSTHAVEPMSIPAQGAIERTLILDRPEGGVLRVVIDRPDALMLDNEAFAILDPIQPATVWLISPEAESFFFEQALLAMESLIDLSGTRVLTPQQFDELGEFAADAGPDLYIFNNATPQRLPAQGRFLFINGWPEDLGPRIIGTLEAPRMLLTQRSHPLVQYLNLRPVQMARARRLDRVEPAQVLAESEDGAPLMVQVDQPGRRSLMLAFDVLESDLPFRNAFPILLRNTVAYFIESGAARIPAEHEIGDVISPAQAMPPTVESVHALVSTGSAEPTERDITVESGSFQFQDTGRQSVVRFEWGSETIYTAVNLTDEDESRITPVPPPSDAAERLGLSRQLLGTTPWIALAWLALGLVALEWWTYHKRWTE